MWCLSPHHTQIQFFYLQSTWFLGVEWKWVDQQWIWEWAIFFVMTASKCFHLTPSRQWERRTCLSHQPQLLSSNYTYKTPRISNSYLFDFLSSQLRGHFLKRLHILALANLLVATEIIFLQPGSHFIKILI
jgi:hypothetical protein